MVRSFFDRTFFVIKNGRQPARQHSAAAALTQPDPIAIAGGGEPCGAFRSDPAAGMCGMLIRAKHEPFWIQRWRRTMDTQKPRATLGSRYSLAEKARRLSNFRFVELELLELLAGWSQSIVHIPLHVGFGTQMYTQAMHCRDLA